MEEALSGSGCKYISTGSFHCNLSTQCLATSHVCTTCMAKETWPPIDSQWFPSFATRTTTQRLATKSNECVHTPTRLRFIDPILWRASAIGMKHELSFHLALTMVQEVEDERLEAWNVRILNYSHIIQNQLLIRSTRRAQRIFPLFVDEAGAEAPVVGAANVLHMLDPLAPVTEPIPIEGVTDSCV